MMDELIKQLVDRCREHFGYYDIVDECSEMVDYGSIIEFLFTVITGGVAISKMETVATDNNVGDKWIPVTERLPKGAKEGEISENVIAYTIDGEVTTGWLDALGSDKWWLVIGTEDSHTCWGLGYVTHWMPLPKPPLDKF